MEDMRTESPKPKTGVIVTAIIASAVIFGGLGYYIGQMYETAPVGTVTYASPSTSTSTSASTAANKTYTNAEGKYSVKLPPDWTVKEGGDDNPADPSVIFSSPETLNPPTSDPGKIYTNYDILVTHYATIAGAGDAFSVKATTLKDFVTKNSEYSNAKSTTFAGQPAYTATFLEPGNSPDYYGIIVEYSGGVYIARFPHIAKESELSTTEKSILDSFTFTK